MKTCFLFLFCILSTSLFAQTIEQTSGRLTNNEKPCIINADIVWQYIDCLETPSTSYFQFCSFRFSGTTEKNGYIYHNLYHNWNSIDELDVTEEAIRQQAMFDISDLEPTFYIRQDGNKYYMLWVQEELPILMNGLVKYGSPEIESLIYDFSIPEGESFELCTAKTAPYTFPESYYWGFQHYGDEIIDKLLPDSQDKFLSDKITRKRTEKYKFGNEVLPLTNYTGYIESLVSEKYGVLYSEGILPLPYSKPRWAADRKYPHGINNIYDAEGNIVLEGLNFQPAQLTPPTPLGIVESADDNLRISFANGTLNIVGVEGNIEVRIHDLIGRCVWAEEAFVNISEKISGLQRGIYIIEVITEGGRTSKKIAF